jgi:hypothetical protein
LHWCIGGDFNITRFPSERSGTTCFCPAMMDFSNCIFDHDGPSSCGGSYTWSNNQESSLLVQDRQIPCFSSLGNLVFKLGKLCSDHFPILLDFVTFIGEVGASNLRTCGWSKRFLCIT